MFRVRNFSVYILAGILAFASCSKPTEVTLKLSSADIQIIGLESISDLYIGEAACLANSIAQHIGDSTLGIYRSNPLFFTTSTLRKWDKRLACAAVTLTNAPSSLPSNPQGTITIYYDSTITCSDTTGVQRKGTITISYSGLRYGIGSTRVINYQDYSSNGIRIKGICTLTILSDSAATDSLNTTFKVSQVVNGGSLIFSDGRTITRNQNFTHQWNHARKLTSDTIAQYFKGGTANGSMKDSVFYQMVINEDLFYSHRCLFSKEFTPITGIKTLRVGNTIYNIDYGLGVCNNNKVTVMVNGLSKLVALN